MKPLKGDQQLRSISLSLSYSVALQALKPKSSPPRRRGLDASTHRGLTESSGEVFLLDILSHRMSALAIYRQLRAGSSFRVADETESTEKDCLLQKTPYETCRHGRREMSATNFCDAMLRTFLGSLSVHPDARLVAFPFPHERA